MLDIIKLLIFFIVFLIGCKSAGLRLLKKLNININLIVLPIGMALFGCIYELFVLPVQYFWLDSSLLKCALILTIVIIFIYGRKELFNVYKQFSKRDIVIFIVFIIMFIVNTLNLEYSLINVGGDNTYYISLINGISMDGIRVNGPDASSFIGALHSQTYAYYGHMHFLGAVSNLLRVDALLTINFFQEWYKIIFYITNIYNIYLVCIKYQLLNNINKYLVLLFIGLPYLGFSSEASIISVHTTTMMFVVAPLIFYLKDHNKGWLVLFGLFAYHAISIRSTYIFLLSFFMLPYYLYLLINNKFEAKENVLIIAPILFALIMWFSYRKSILILLVFLLILLLIIIFIPKIVKKIGIKYTKYIYFGILICILTYFAYKSMFLGNTRATFDDILIYDLLLKLFFDFSSYTSVIRSTYHIIYLVMGVLLLVFVLIRKKEISYITVHIITIFILCLNPIVGPYIAHFLSEVYDRLFQLWVNPLFFLLALNESLNIIKHNKNIIVSYLPTILIVYFLLYSFIEYALYVKNNVKSYINNKEEISFLYKIPNSICELGKVVEEYAKENNLKYVQVACPPDSIFRMSFMSNRIRLSSLMGSGTTVGYFIDHDYYIYQWSEDTYEHPIFFYLLEPYRFFDDWRLEYDRDNIPDLKALLKNNKTDIYIMKKWNNREETSYHLKEYLEGFSIQLFENDNYLVYCVK